MEKPHKHHKELARLKSLGIWVTAIYSLITFILIAWIIKVPKYAEPTIGTYAFLSICYLVAMFVLLKTYYAIKYAE